MSDSAESEEPSGKQAARQVEPAKLREDNAKLLHKRWLRDFTSQGLRYVPEEQAKPSRMYEGFELRDNGTYVELSAGANDAEVQAAGTWLLEEDGALMLTPAAPARSLAASRPSARRIRILELDDNQLVVEEEPADAPH